MIQYDILPSTITDRLQFATSAMHAYGHQWSCQLVYNPRLRVGLGLTDGEGTERLWSRLRKLIAITRGSGVSNVFTVQNNCLYVYDYSVPDVYGFLTAKLLLLIVRCEMALEAGFDVGCEQVFRGIRRRQNLN